MLGYTRLKYFSRILLISFLSLTAGIHAKVIITSDSKTENTQQLKVFISDPLFEPVFIDHSSWFIPQLPEGGHTLEKGAPQLPVISRNILLPDIGDVSVRVTINGFRDYTDTPVAPSKGPLPRSVNPADIPYTFNNTYDASFWPNDIVETGTPYILRRHRGITLRICPFRYFPAEKRLRLFTDFEIDIIIRSTDGENTLSRKTLNMSVDAPVFESIYASHFINYNSTPRRYTPLSDTNDHMLIIAADGLVSAAQPFVNWKNQRGIHTVMVPLSSIGTTTAQIKDYVQDYYNTNGLTYLLLVGDGEDIPSPHVSDGASDPTYSKLAGSDNYPDIFVGRLCSSSSEDISIMVQRTIDYEKNASATDAWYPLATGLASDEGSSPSDIEHMDAIRSNLLAHGYSHVDALYDPGVTVSQVADSVNHGRGLINYVGHGNFTEWVTSGFSNSDVNNLTNTMRWPFIFDVACLNGCFTGRTCFAEAWTRAAYNGIPVGAAAIYASTVEQDWSPPMTAQNEFNTLLTTGDIHSFGALCFNASMKMMDDWGSTGVDMFNTWTVFGDPSLLVRTDVPAALSVTHAEDLSTAFTVRVSGVEGALASISLTNTLLASGYTDPSGICVLSPNEFPTQDVLLTVTAFNSIMYTSMINVCQTELVCHPESFEQHLISGNMTNISLVISNAGEAASILNYTISVLPDYSHSRRTESFDLPRNITGSTLTLIPSEFTPGGTTTLTIVVENQSSDNEWIKAAFLHIPSNITAEGSTMLSESSWGLAYDGTTGTATTIGWLAEDPNDDSITTAATGTVTLSFSPSANGPFELAWSLTGDEYGSDPHSCTGTVTLTAKAPPAPTVTLTAPNGEEAWEIGSTQRIEWSSVNYSNIFNIDYSSDGGMHWFEAANSLPYTNSYEWHLSMTNQSSNCLIRVYGTNTSIAATSAAPFCVFYPLNWLSVSPASGSITGNASDHIVVSFDATGKSNGIYHALLQVRSSQKTILIPTALFVSNTVPLWVITPTAGPHGSILPATAITVSNGASASFVVTAETGYYIRTFSTNGSSACGVAGLSVYTSSWHNITSNGTLDSSFAETSTQTATNGTSIPWLRQYYTNEPDIQALADRAAQDTDGDRMAGWEEYIALTDPTNPVSAFNQFSIRSDQKTGHDVLQWYSAIGRVYSIYTTESLATPFLLLTNGLTYNVNGWRTFTNANIRPSLFYKLTVEP